MVIIGHLLNVMMFYNRMIAKVGMKFLCFVRNEEIGGVITERMVRINEED